VVPYNFIYNESEQILPNENWEFIFRHTNVSTVFTISITCIQFNKLINQSILFKLCDIDVLILKRKISKQGYWYNLVRHIA